MIKIFSAAVILLFGFMFFLLQDGKFKSNGTITGYDPRDCPCCGGFLIQIDSTTYRFYDLPQGSELNLDNPEFPVHVKLDWIPDTVACMGDEIIVKRIERL